MERGIKPYVNWRGWGILPGDPRLVSLNASYHKEQQYIYGLGGGVLKGS